MKDESPFELFWQASSLDAYNVQSFANGLSDYDSDNKELELAYPLAGQPLPKTASVLNHLSGHRSSKRAFSKTPLSIKQLSRLLSSFKAEDLEHRAYPSAGATYCTEVYIVPFNVHPKYNAGIYYYSARTHALVNIKNKGPDWEEAEKQLNIEVSGIPQVLILLVTLTDRAVTKYGERGGRFALIELGAAMQQLAIQVASSRKLKGVAVGGVMDNYWLKQLGLNKTTAKLGLGYLVGL